MDGAQIRDFNDLIVWQKSMELAQQGVCRYADIPEAGGFWARGPTAAERRFGSKILPKEMADGLRKTMFRSCTSPEARSRSSELN